MSHHYVNKYYNKRMWKLSWRDNNQGNRWCYTPKFREIRLKLLYIGRVSFSHSFFRQLTCNSAVHCCIVSVERYFMHQWLHIFAGAKETVNIITSVKSRSCIHPIHALGIYIYFTFNEFLLAIFTGESCSLQKCKWK